MSTWIELTGINWKPAYFDAGRFERICPSRDEESGSDICIGDSVVYVQNDPKEVVSKIDEKLALHFKREKIWDAFITEMKK